VKPPPEIALRQVHEYEAEDLASLRVAAMRESLELVGRFDPTRARERFLVGFSAIHTSHIVEGDVKVGFVVVRPHETGLLIDHLYVQPGSQGKGIGAAVLALVFAEADRQGKSLRVGALKESRSNQFYARHGFGLVEQGEWDNYYVRHAQCTHSRQEDA
jgi:GNAT superfamily N-acetyltransferase